MHKAKLPKKRVTLDSTGEKKRLNRARGQLDAVGRMLDEQRYCPEIIQQIRATRNALKALELEVLKNHLEGCVKSAFESKSTQEKNEKIREIMRLVSNQ